MELAINYQVEERIKRLVIIFCVLLLSLSCKKDEENEVLPQLTNTGIGSLGCSLNSEVWLPRQIRFTLFPTPTYLECNYSPESGRLWISARREYKNSSIYYETLTLEVSSIFQTGLYPFINQSSSFDRFFSDETSDLYDENDFLTGNCKITFIDTSKKIISGTFEISFVKADTKKIDIKNGIFDLKY